MNQKNQKMRTDFDYLEVTVSVKEYPSLGGLLVYKKFAVPHEVIENDITLFTKALEKTVLATLRKALE